MWAQVMQDLHSALEEAKADAVGLWATHYLMDKGLIIGLTAEALYERVDVCIDMCIDGRWACATRPLESRHRGRSNLVPAR